MKAAEYRLFQASVTQCAPAPTPKQLPPYFDSWSMVTFIYPSLKEGDYLWTDNAFSCLYKGTKEMYLEWLGEQTELPNPTGTVEFYPLGLVLIVKDGQRVHGTGHTNKSNACAGRSDFKALAIALGNGEVGTGTYTTYCNYFGVKRPAYFVFEEQRGEEENNFLVEFFQNRK